MNSDLGHSASSASQASTTPPSALPDRLGEIALRIAKDESYRHRAAEALLAIATDLRDRELPQDAALKAIGDLAHDKSTGPAVPDTLWEIRGIAYEALGAPLVVEAEPATTKRITPDAPASPAPPQGEREGFEAAMRDRYNCTDHSFVRAPDGYAHTVGHRSMRLAYASVQMLWETFQAGRASLRASTQPAVSTEARDAARYRWLRDIPATAQADHSLRQWLWSRPGGAASIDAAIDAAMGNQSAGKEKGD